MDIETEQIRSESMIKQCYRCRRHRCSWCTNTLVIIGLLFFWFAFVSLCFFLDDCLRFEICDYEKSMGNPAKNTIAITLVYLFSMIGVFIVLLMQAKCRNQ